ncbi:Transcription factor [Dirofilaria immitis]
MYSLHSLLLWIFLTVVTLTEITCGIVINSFNGLIVGSGELNDIANDIPAIGIFNDLGGFGPLPASTFAKSRALPSPISLPPGTSINSFRNNIGGLGSFQNNAGVSLLPTGPATSSEITRALAAARAYSAIARGEEIRRRMQLWASQLRARYRFIYSMYPFYFYG